MTWPRRATRFRHKRAVWSRANRLARELLAREAARLGAWLAAGDG